MCHLIYSEMYKAFWTIYLITPVQLEQLEKKIIKNSITWYANFQFIYSNLFKLNFTDHLSLGKKMYENNLKKKN